ncbi:hypothetical protein GCM10023082_29320 [Streptomyces tremellae]|uniref:Uncharacterized protein n=1 Tax=Streptomyces tremellae TaxID=1124239 RepID=A0ABP7F2Q8_9ACTN
MSVKLSAASAAIHSMWPGTVSLVARGADRATQRLVGRIPAMPMGRVTTRMLRQSSALTSGPPGVGPRPAEVPTIADHRPSIRVRSRFSGKANTRSDSELGMKRAAPTPWRRRAPMSTARRRSRPPGGRSGPGGVRVGYQREGWRCDPFPWGGRESMCEWPGALSGLTGHIGDRRGHFIARSLRGRVQGPVLRAQLTLW